MKSLYWYIFYKVAFFRIWFLRLFMFAYCGKISTCIHHYHTSGSCNSMYVWKYNTHVLGLWFWTKKCTEEKKDLPTEQQRFTWQHHSYYQLSFQDVIILLPNPSSAACPWATAQPEEAPRAILGTALLSMRRIFCKLVVGLVGSGSLAITV